MPEATEEKLISEPKPNKSTPPNPESNNETSKSTLFVRGIPFTTTNQQLEAFFSDIGPVLKCFVVQDKSVTEFKNKGFGFVTFAIVDDAVKAKDELTKVLFDGKRKLKIELALKKNGVDDDKKKRDGI